jgi:hypothetical protein
MAFKRKRVRSSSAPPKTSLWFIAAGLFVYYTRDAISAHPSMRSQRNFIFARRLL